MEDGRDKCNWGKNFWGSAMWDLYGVDVSTTGPVQHVVYLGGPTSAGRARAGEASYLVGESDSKSLGI